MMIDRPAPATDQMELIVDVGDLPPGGVVDSEVRLAHQAELLEQRQRAVHGGQVDRRIDFAAVRCDLFGGGVAAGRPQHL